VPLYYPETLAQAVRSEPTGLTEYPFWTMPNGFVGQLVASLRQKIEEMPCITVIHSPIKSLHHLDGRWTAVIDAGNIHESPQLALGLSLDRASILLNTPVSLPSAAASVSLLFSMVRSDQIRIPHVCTMLLDDELASYRLTDQDALAGLDPEWHRVTLEASPEMLARLYPKLSTEAALRVELAILLGMAASDDAAINVLKCITVHNALVIPSSIQVSQIETASTEISNAAPGAILTGTLLGYGVASLNDQLVQGLKITEQFL
jgi:hypothetical protein